MGHCHATSSCKSKPEGSDKAHGRKESIKNRHAQTLNPKTYHPPTTPPTSCICPSMCTRLVVSHNNGTPNIDPETTIVLIIGTPKRYAQFWETPVYDPERKREGPLGSADLAGREETHPKHGCSGGRAGLRYPIGFRV